MRRLIITLVLVLVFGCDEGADYVVDYDAGADTDEEIDTGDVVETYPQDGWGYKPVIRTTKNGLVADEGDTLPYIDLGGLKVSEQIWQSDNGLEPLFWSIRDCPPCDELYKIAERGYVILVGESWDDALELKGRYPNLVFAADQNWQFGLPWERDYWPETMRGYPTVQWVDTATMTIVFEQIGYMDVATWQNEYNEKYSFWKGLER